MSKMRCITLVDSAQVEFPGNIFKNAIILGDVDNDGLNELVVASQKGDLVIFKGAQSSKPWKRAVDLGMVTAVGIGDIFNVNRNSIVVISGEGWCYIFDFVFGAKNEDGDVIFPVHTQRMPANVKAMIVDDVNDDGEVELVIALTDRVVRSYKWSPNDSTPPRKSTLPANVTGKLVAFNKWEFANQIGNITKNIMADGTPTLLVSHPGGTFIRLKLGRVENVTESSEPLSSNVVAYHTLGLSQMRNPNVSTEIIGFIRDVVNPVNKEALPFAIATLDGTLMLVKEDVSLWSLQVDHGLFSLSKLDVTGDGRDEIIACAWDGYTYIVNTEGRAVRFSFGHSVSAFCAGLFSVDGVQNSCSFVYATFEGKIHIHYNVHVEQTELVTYKDFLSPDMSLTLQSFGVESSDSEKMRELANYLLYGLKRS